jgi:lambda family phage portal protein
MNLRRIREGMQPNAIDKVVNFIAPAWGAQRMRARAFLAIGGAFTGASKSRNEFQNFNPVVQSPDDELYSWDRKELVARSSDLERNDPVGGGIIAEYVTSVAGTGLSLHLEPKRAILGWDEDQAAEWAQGVQERFSLWAENASECDIARKSNFYQAQVLALITVATRGDVFAVLPNRKNPGGVWGTKVQLIEGDRCFTPMGMLETETFKDGIELDEFGSPRRYWFSKTHPGACISTSKDNFLPPIEAFDSKGRRRVVHLYHEKRLGQRRGYPLLAPVLLPLKQLSRLGEAELMASVVTSMFAVLIEKSGGSGPLAGIVQNDTAGNPFTELGHGMIADLNPGEKVQTVAPNRPNGAYDPFFRGIVGQIAMRVQIPPEVLFKKFESSYTAARGALLQFWKFVTMERDQFLGPNFCQPIFDVWLAEDVATGGTVAPGFFRDPVLRYAYSSARWIGDNPPILDPLKEVLAAEHLVNYQFSTFEEQTMRLTGGSYEANIERMKRERRLRADAGIPDPAAKPIDPNLDKQVEQQTAQARISAEASVAQNRDLVAAITSRPEPSITVEGPTVNVEAAAPPPPASVNVAAPVVNVENHMTPRGGKETVQILRDAAGAVSGALKEETTVTRSIQIERDTEGRPARMTIEE